MHAFFEEQHMVDFDSSSGEQSRFSIVILTDGYEGSFFTALCFSADAFFFGSVASENLFLVSWSFFCIG